MRRNKWIGYMLVSPAVLLIFGLMISPIFYTGYISLHKFANLQIGKFVSFNNYLKLLSDRSVMNSIGTGLEITFLALSCAMFFGILASLWLHSKRGTQANLLQLLCLIPWFTSLIISALNWRWIVNTDYGLLNSILKNMGVPIVQILESTALSFLMVSFIMAWRTTGYIMILVLSGLKSLSEEMLEAAKVDGASYLQTLFHIKFPNIRSQIILAFIMITLANLNNSTIPLAFNNGGPAGATTTVALKLYTLGFADLDFGKGSALSVLMLLINLLIIVFYMRSMRYEKV